MNDKTTSTVSKTYTLVGGTPAVEDLGYGTVRLGILNDIADVLHVYINPDVESESFTVPASSYKEVDVRTDYYRLECATGGSVIVDIAREASSDYTYNTPDKAQSYAIESKYGANASTDPATEFSFDINDSAAYTAAKSTYSDAWGLYYGSGTAPATYSPEAALKLNLAIAFYKYSQEGPPAEETYSKQASVDSRDFSPYAREPGSGVQTLENPNAFYDDAVYKSATSSGTIPLPKVEMNSGKTISSHSDSGRGVDYTQLYSPEQLTMTEYETTHAQPKSAWDWGSAYSMGKKTY